MSDPLYDLAMAAAEVKHVAPNEFNKLLEAVGRLAGRVQRDYNAAGPETIFPMQGKVQLMSQILNKFETCHLIFADATRR